MANEYSVNQSDLVSVANAIRTKGGTSEALVFPDGFVSAVQAIQAGGGGGSTPSTNRDEVIFIDYDGTVLYTYTLEEAGALTELPPLPSHAGLICQEWNYTLNEVTSTTTPIVVGANYTTSDGKTRLYLTFYSEDDTSIKLALYVSGEIVIDWGDGSNTESILTSGRKTIPHTYTVNTYPQSVVIEIHATSGEFEIGNGSATYGVLRSDDSTLTTTALTAVEIGENVPWINALSFAYSPRLKTIAINKDCIKFSSGSYSAWSTTRGDISCGVVALIYPRGTSTSNYPGYIFTDCKRMKYVSTPKTLASVASIGNGAFKNCYSLSSITIPANVTRIESNAFYNCYSMSSITIPDSVASIRSYAFAYCYSLSSITIPDSVASIGNGAFQDCYLLSSITIPANVTRIESSAFQDCYLLSSITIPANVTSIESSAFQDCYAIAYYDFTALSAVPTLSNTNAFSGIPADCEIRVPASLAEEWKAATNWATYADYIVGV